VRLDKYGSFIAFWAPDRLGRHIPCTVDDAREWGINMKNQSPPSVVDEKHSVPDRIEIDQPQAKHPRTAPLDGWRCDFCGEIVTAQERPLAAPEKCARCSSSHITSVEAWATRPRLGLWTR